MNNADVVIINSSSSNFLMSSVFYLSRFQPLLSLLGVGAGNTLLGQLASAEAKALPLSLRAWPEGQGTQ